MGIGFNPFPTRYKHPSKFKDRQWLNFLDFPYPLQFYRDLVVVPPIKPIDTTWPDEGVIEQGNMPYLVIFHIDGSYSGFTGVLIDLQYIVVSGFVADYLGSQAGGGATITAGVGGVNTDLSDAEQVDEPKVYSFHPSYNPSTGENDIGVISMSSPFTGGTNVGVVGYSDTDESTYVAGTLISCVGGVKYSAGSPSDAIKIYSSAEYRFTDLDAGSLFFGVFLAAHHIAMQDSDDIIYSGYGSPLLANNGNGGDYLVGVCWYPPTVSIDDAQMFTRVSVNGGYLFSETGVLPNPGT